MVDGSDTEAAGHRPPISPLRETPPFVNRVVIAADIARYAARSSNEQLLTFADLDRLVNQAASSVGLDVDTWDRQGRGDGILAVLPAETDLVTVVGPFVSELRTRLAALNEALPREWQTQMRLGVDIGTFASSGPALTGQVLGRLARLLDSPAVRLSDPAQEMGVTLVVSKEVFHRATGVGLGGLDPRSFQEVRVPIPGKGFSMSAFLQQRGAGSGFPEASGPSPGPRIKTGADQADALAPLTSREREVAMLAASGRTSPEIAETLYLSVRTVDSHLHRVYRKLGIGGRRELADTVNALLDARSKSRSDDD